MKSLLPLKPCQIAHTLLTNTRLGSRSSKSQSHSGRAGLWWQGSDVKATVISRISRDTRLSKSVLWEDPLGTPAGTQRPWKQRLKALSLNKKCRGSRAKGEHCGEVGIVCGEGENVCSKKERRRDGEERWGLYTGDFGHWIQG